MTPDAWESLFRAAIEAHGYTIDVANLYIAIGSQLPRKYAMRDYVRIHMRELLRSGAFEIAYAGYPSSRSDPTVVDDEMSADAEAERLCDAIDAGFVLLPLEGALRGLRKTIDYRRIDLPELRLRGQVDRERAAAKIAWKLGKRLRRRARASKRPKPQWKLFFRRFPPAPRADADVYELTEALERIEDAELLLAELSNALEEFDGSPPEARAAAWKRVVSAVESPIGIYSDELLSEDARYDEDYYPND